MAVAGLLLKGKVMWFTIIIKWLRHRKESPYEFVRRIWGNCTDGEADTLLWHCTAFPFVDVPRLERQLREVKKKSSGDFQKALKIADAEIEEAMRGL